MVKSDATITFRQYKGTSTSIEQEVLAYFNYSIITSKKDFSRNIQFLQIRQNEHECREAKKQIDVFTQTTRKSANEHKVFSLLSILVHSQRLCLSVLFLKKSFSGFFFLMR